jgi:hypothetical protein
LRDVAAIVTSELLPLFVGSVPKLSTETLKNPQLCFDMHRVKARLRLSVYFSAFLIVRGENHSLHRRKAVRTLPFEQELGVRRLHCFYCLGRDDGKERGRTFRD